MRPCMASAQGRRRLFLARASAPASAAKGDGSAAGSSSTWPAKLDAGRARIGVEAERQVLADDGAEIDAAVVIDVRLVRPRRRRPRLAAFAARRRVLRRHERQVDLLRARPARPDRASRRRSARRRRRACPRTVKASAADRAHLELGRRALDDLGNAERLGQARAAPPRPASMRKCRPAGGNVAGDDWMGERLPLIIGLAPPAVRRAAGNGTSPRRSSARSAARIAATAAVRCAARARARASSAPSGKDVARDRRGERRARPPPAPAR